MRSGQRRTIPWATSRAGGWGTGPARAARSARRHDDSVSLSRHRRLISRPLMSGARYLEPEDTGYFRRWHPFRVLRRCRASLKRCFNERGIPRRGIPQATQPDQLDNRPRHIPCLLRSVEVLSRHQPLFPRRPYPCRSSYIVLCRHSSCSACQAPPQRQGRPLDTRSTIPPPWPCSKP